MSKVIKSRDEQIVLNEIQEKILWLMQNYGTSVYGEEYRLAQVAKAIDQMYFEIAEVSEFISMQKFQFVSVMPR